MTAWWRSGLCFRTGRLHSGGADRLPPGLRAVCAKPSVWGRPLQPLGCFLAPILMRDRADAWLREQAAYDLAWERLCPG